MNPKSLLDLAADAAIPLECASAIAEVAGRGFIVWLPFIASARPKACYYMRAFSSLEKCQKAYVDVTNVKLSFISYRLHLCGAKDVVYVYESARDFIVSNVVEDFENLVHSRTAHREIYGCAVAASDYAYKIE
jgi:hypothetical protein